MTLLCKFWSRKVDAELKQIEEIVGCKKHSGRTVIPRGCEGKCLSQNHKSYQVC